MRAVLPSLVLTASLAVAGCSGGGGGGGSGGNEIEVLAVGRNHGLPMAGMAVAANDADGDFLRLTETDNDGRATIRVPDGGSLTALDTPASASDLQWYLETVFSPPPGVVIQLLVQDEALGPNASNLEITFEDAPAETSLWSWTAICPNEVLGSAEGTPFATNISCAAGGTADVHALALSSSANGLAWGSTSDVSLTAGTVPVTVSLANTNFDVVDVSAQAPADLGASFLAVLGANGRDYPSASVNVAGSVAGQTVSAPVNVIPGSHDLYYVGISLSSAVSSASRTIVSATLPSTASWDGASIARVGNVDLDLVDPLRPELEWQTFGSGPRATIGRARVAYQMGDSRMTWDVRYDPSERLSIVMPELPPEFADAAPGSGQEYTSAIVIERNWTGMPSFADSLVGPLLLDSAGVFEQTGGSAPIF